MNVSIFEKVCASIIGVILYIVLLFSFGFLASYLIGIEMKEGSTNLDEFIGRTYIGIFFIGLWFGAGSIWDFGVFIAKHWGEDPKRNR
jgi:hypothetical protein